VETDNSISLLIESFGSEMSASTLGIDASLVTIILSDILKNETLETEENKFNAWRSVFAFIIIVLASISWHWVSNSNFESNSYSSLPFCIKKASIFELIFLRTNQTLSLSLFLAM